MRKLLATAALLLASTAAQAQYTIEYGGRTIRIDPDRGTVSIPGVYDNTGQGKAKKAKKNEAKPDQQTPQQAKVDPQPPAAAPAPAPAVAAPPPTTANNAPGDTAVLPQPTPPPAPARVEQQAATPPATVVPPASPAAPPAPAPLRPPRPRRRPQPRRRAIPIHPSASGSPRRRKARSASSNAAAISAAIRSTPNRTRTASRC